MGPIEIRKIISGRDLTAFINFPWKIYRQDPYWVPPLVRDMTNRFNPRKNPFFEHAEVQSFMAYKGKEPLGRITGIINFKHNEFSKERAAFFGFFECVNDQDVANVLLDTVKNWAKEKEMEILRGPASFSSNDDWGALVEGFDSSPRILMPYNPDYYNALFKNYGFHKEKDLLAFQLDIQSAIPQRFFKAEEVLKQRYNIKIRSIDMTNFEEEMNIIHEIYNSSWDCNWGFVPMTETEIRHQSIWLKPVLIPELVLIAEFNGKPAAYILTIPDYNQAVKHMNGWLLPFGIINVMFKASKLTGVRMTTLGVIKEYRQKGLESLLYLEVWQACKKKGFIDAELSWIPDDNHLMRNGIEKAGGKRNKTYRIYKKEI